MLLDELIVRITGGDAAVQYAGDRSLFPDVGTDAPYYAAAVRMTSRGIMETGNRLTGGFVPHRPVAGADALLMLRKVREELR